MTAYQNCEVSDVMSVTLPSGVAGEGRGFSIRSENKRPLVTLSLATREDAEQARAEVASAIPFVQKEDGRTTGHPGPPSGSATGRSRGGPLCPEQSGDPWVGCVARLHVCPSPSAPNLCLAPSWARGFFCLRVSVF